MPSFTASATFRCAPEILRDYLGTPGNLSAISDPELELEVIAAPDKVHIDALIDFRITAYGFKQRMQHRYISVEALEIVAEQTEGPTKAWTHRQTIVDNGDGTCTLTDHFDFEPPGGMLGFVMTEARIIESLQDGMDFRYEALQEILE